MASKLEKEAEEEAAAARKRAAEASDLRSKKEAEEEEKRAELRARGRQGRVGPQQWDVGPAEVFFISFSFSYIRCTGPF